MDNAPWSSNFARRCALAFVLLAAPGCMTVFSQGCYVAGRAPDNMVDPRVVVYGGLRNDVRAIGNLMRNDEMWREQRVVCSLSTVALGLDVVLSTVADTVILPITVVEALCMRDDASEAESEAR